MGLYLRFISSRERGMRLSISHPCLGRTVLFLQVRARPAKRLNLRLATGMLIRLRSTRSGRLRPSRVERLKSTWRGDGLAPQGSLPLITGEPQMGYRGPDAHGARPDNQHQQNGAPRRLLDPGRAPRRSCPHVLESRSADYNVGAKASRVVDGVGTVGRQSARRQPDEAKLKGETLDVGSRFASLACSRTLVVRRRRLAPGDCVKR